MAIATEDGVVVDLMLGKISSVELRSTGVRSLDVDRIAAVNKLIRLIGQAPETEPPAQLMERTLARVRQANRN
jgi:hypothetical protein